ncbi:MAG: (2Fe-2S)-binding protein [Qingshengfaniella sp.]
MAARDVTLSVNGTAQHVHVDPETPLVHVLRETLGLTGTKFSCEGGPCGACVVWMDGAPIRSCVIPIDTAEGTEITTIEGLSAEGLHPVQQA